MNDLTYGDDSFNFDPSQFEFGGQVAPPQPGEYSITGRIQQAKDKNGNPLVGKNGEPVMQIARAQIVDPEGGQSVGLFADIRTGFFTRKDGKKGNQALEALGSINIGLLQEFAGMASEDIPMHAKDVLERELSGGGSLRVKLGYQGTDTAWAKSQLSDNSTPEEKRLVWNKARLYNKAFKRPDGKGYLQEIVSPAGNPVKAKLVIDSFVPSNKHGKSGPYYS